MCTVTYLPLPGPGFLLTQSRDESPFRPGAHFPVKETRNGKDLIFPQDPAGGGSWIATDGKEQLCCLMNGAFEEHTPKPPYRMSRGQILLDAAAASSPQEFVDNYNLEDIEPFTLLFFRSEDDIKIHELRWDGEKKFFRTFHSGKPQIWSSSQIYSTEQQLLREDWFREWLDNMPLISPEEALNFHLTAGDENPGHSLLIDRGYVKTVSLTQAKGCMGKIELSFVPIHKPEVNN